MIKARKDAEEAQEAQDRKAAFLAGVQAIRKNAAIAESSRVQREEEDKIKEDRLVEDIRQRLLPDFEPPQQTQAPSPVKSKSLRPTPRSQAGPGTAPSQQHPSFTFTSPLRRSKEFQKDLNQGESIVDHLSPIQHTPPKVIRRQQRRVPEKPLAVTRRPAERKLSRDELKPQEVLDREAKARERRVRQKAVESAAADRRRILRAEKLQELKKKEEDELKKISLERAAAQDRRKRQRIKAQEREERLREAIQRMEDAGEDHLRLTVKHYGFLPWRRLVELARTNENVAIAHYQQILKSKSLLSLHLHCNDQNDQRMSKASDIHKVFLLRKSLNSLRKAVIAERCNNECAEKHHQASLQRKVLTAWLRSALVGAGQREVRVIAMLASAAENHDKQLLRKALASLKGNARASRAIPPSTSGFQSRMSNWLTDFRKEHPTPNMNF